MDGDNAARIIPLREVSRIIRAVWGIASVLRRQHLGLVVAVKFGIASVDADLRRWLGIAGAKAPVIMQAIF